MIKEFILNQKQKKIIECLDFLKKYNFYLAGGTALALQLGHRKSIDLDFYTKKHFQSEILLKNLEKNCKSKAIRYSLARDTLFVRILDTDLSFFFYQYPLIRPLIKFKEINLASKEDISAMKFIAIIQRATRRDYIDIYFLMKQLGIEKLFDFTQEKYPEFNSYLALRALQFFADVGERKGRERKRIYIYSGITWPAIKKYLINEVKKYQLSLIKK